MMMFLYRCWAYFRRGHGVYLALAISLVNFLTIQYNFLVLESTTLKSMFQDIVAFGAVFGVLYMAVAIVIGWLDMRKGAMATEQMINPYIIDTVKYNSLICDALVLIAEGRRFEAEDKLSEARAVMERWGASSTSS